MPETDTDTTEDGRTPTTLALAADGFDLLLSVLTSPARSYRDRFFNGTATLQPTVVGNIPTLHTQVTGLLTDLERLCDWIEDHVQALVNRRPHQSRTWVPLDLDMSVECLLGEIDRVDGVLDGDFSIRVMLRVGRDRNATAIYAGLEGSVGVQEALAFCTATRAYIVANT